jgi:hypothetical protein
MRVQLELLKLNGEWKTYSNDEVAEAIFFGMLDLPN